MLTDKQVQKFIVTTVGVVYPDVLPDYHLEPLYCLRGFIYASEEVSKYIPYYNPRARFIDYSVGDLIKTLVPVGLDNLP